MGPHLKNTSIWSPACYVQHKNRYLRSTKYGSNLLQVGYPTLPYVLNVVKVIKTDICTTVEGEVNLVKAGL